MNDVFIRVVTFPSLRVSSAVRVDNNGDYNIYIDERLSDEAKKRKLNHELTHIKRNHFSDCVSVTDAENEAGK